MTAKPPAAADDHEEDLLDEALDESFPASDPPSMTASKQHPSKPKGEGDR